MAAVASGMVGAGLILGLVAGLVRSALPSRPPEHWHPRFWIARFAVVTACAVAPLLFIGGLVTSTDSGMAVPDWPTTFGSGMLAYPLGERTPQDIFLEHSHRLFGMLVGLATLALLAWVLIDRVGGRARLLAASAFILVCGQGVLGGLRVRSDSRPLAMLHGILAQLVFGLIVTLAVHLSPAFSVAPPAAGLEPRRIRRLKIFATALLHALILQLLLGAVTRHFRRTNHPLWTHAALSLVIMSLATTVGFAAAGLPRAPGGGAALVRCGRALVAIVTLQFLLGWGAFLIRGPNIRAGSTAEALIRTAHQANGGLLLGAAACAVVWAGWLARGVRAATPESGPSQPGTPAPALTGADNRAPAA